MRVGTSEPTSPHVDVAINIDSERKAEVGSEERAPILFNLPLDLSARRYPAWRAVFSRLELTQGRERW